MVTEIWKDEPTLQLLRKAFTERMWFAYVRYVHVEFKQQVVDAWSPVPSSAAKML